MIPKKPYILSKEPFIFPKKPYIHPKEPYKPTKTSRRNSEARGGVVHQNARCKKSSIFSHKSPIFYQKSPIFYQKRLIFSQKRPAKPKNAGCRISEGFRRLFALYISSTDSYTALWIKDRALIQGSFG